jgi:hypothetical protein
MPAAVRCNSTDFHHVDCGVSLKKVVGPVVSFSLWSVFVSGLSCDAAVEV